jgi:hypothetical protein
MSDLSKFRTEDQKQPGDFTVDSLGSDIPADDLWASPNMDFLINQPTDENVTSQPPPPTTVETRIEIRRDIELLQTVEIQQPEMTFLYVNTSDSDEALVPAAVPTAVPYRPTNASASNLGSRSV